MAAAGRLGNGRVKNGSAAFINCHIVMKARLSAQHRDLGPKPRGARKDIKTHNTRTPKHTKIQRQKRDTNRQANGYKQRKAMSRVVSEVKSKKKDEQKGMQTCKHAGSR